MIEIISKLLSLIKSIKLKDVLYCLIIGLLCWGLWTQYSNINNIKTAYENNTKALTDTVSYYESKTGDLVATKTAFECDIKELEILNDSLYAEINDLKIKNEVLASMHVSGKIENPSVDTVFKIKHDTIYNGFRHNFNFNNKWRNLEGNITYITDSLKLDITKDETFFNYTFAIDDKNNIYIKSDNPYIKYNQFTGFTIPKPKEKVKFNIYGIVAYDFGSNKVLPFVGLDVSYKKFNTFYEYDIVNNNHMIGTGYNFKIFDF